MTWALWLAVPLVATALACVWTWWRNRPPAVPGTARAMLEHEDYLAALARPAGSREVTDRRPPKR